MKRRHLALIVVLGLLLIAARPTSSGGVMRVTVNLSASQIRALATTPVEAIPAPGAGQVIWPVRMFVEYTFFTTPYNFSQPLLTVDGDEISVMVEEPFRLDITESQVMAQPLTLYAEGVNPTNKPLTIISSIDPGSAGDGTLRFTIDYEIVTLP